MQHLLLHLLLSLRRQIVARHGFGGSLLRLSGLLGCASGMALAQGAPVSLSMDQVANAFVASSHIPALAPSASLSGSVTDEHGGMIAGAVVTLAVPGATETYTARTETDGGFHLTGLASGPYTLNVVAEGVRPWTGSGVLAEGRGVILPDIALVIKPVEAFVQVSASRTEIAQAQIELAEKQRVLGAFRTSTRPMSGTRRP